MSVICVRMKAKTERNAGDEQDSYCFIYQKDGDLYHAHRNEAGWSESRFSLGTLEHHLTMYHKDRFYTTTHDLPEYIKEKVEQ